MAFGHLDMLSVLMHHGIKGQKWGKRNGPPYPLKPEVKAAAYGEKRKAYGLFSKKKKEKNSVDPRTEASKLGVPVKTNNPANGKYLNHDGEELDPETGLYLKDKSLTIEEDMAKVNPSWTESPQGNCRLCTTTMEMRMRGYDVTAGDADGIDDDAIESWFSDTSKSCKLDRIWFDQDDYDFRTTKGWDDLPEDDDTAGWERYQTELGQYKYDQAEKAMAQTGENARGEFSVINDFWGHSMFYTVKNGKVTVYETQTNKIYSQKELAEMIKGVDAISVTRLDDKPANVEKMKSDGAIVY